MHFNHTHWIAIGVGVAIGYFVVPMIVASVRGNG